MNQLIILAHAPTGTVIDGFLPAARRLGLPVTVLTDHAGEHRSRLGKDRTAAQVTVMECEVANPLAVLAMLACAGAPAALFSSDAQLQTTTAMAAEYLGLAGKDWHVTCRARNQAEMRRRLQEQGLDVLWHAVVCGEEALDRVRGELPFPCIVKPCEGGFDAAPVQDHVQLRSQCAAVWDVQPGLPLIVEEYIAGPVYTLETLGDGRELRVLGSFDAELSQGQRGAVVQTIQEFGIGFGACHTRFVLTPRGPRLVDINYHDISDQAYQRQQALGLALYETVLRLHMGEPLPAPAARPKAPAVRKTARGFLPTRPGSWFGFGSRA